MGLSTGLHDVSGDSLLLVVVAAAAALLSHLRLLLLPPQTPAPFPSIPSIPISFSSLLAIADHIPSSSSSSSSSSDCAVCLSAMAGGDRVRRLSCSHAFHAACIDGWLLLPPAALRCPVCRSPAARPDPDADRRVAADLVACLSHF